jgi:hypothetical protein
MLIIRELSVRKRRQVKKKENKETTSKERHDELFSPPLPLPWPSPTQLSPVPKSPSRQPNSVHVLLLLFSPEPRKDERSRPRGAGKKSEGGGGRLATERTTKRRPDYRDRNADVCPEAPNLCVPETAMERRYPLCPMQKRKTHAHVFQANHVRLVSWKAFYIEHAVRCRRDAGLERHALAGLPASDFPGKRLLAYSTGRQVIQQEKKRPFIKTASRSTASS